MPNASSAEKILVTGATGMLGRAAAKHLSRRRPVQGASLKGADGTLAYDLTDPANVRRLIEKSSPELVVHSAAYIDVDRCEENPQQAHASNALAVKYLASECGRRGIPLLHISTDYMFDGRKGQPYVEEDALCPVNVYGLTKMEGEVYARGCAGGSVIVRTSWLFGDHSPSNFVNWMMGKLKSERMVCVLDNHVNAPTFVEDLSKALETICDFLFLKKTEGKAPGVREVFHVCNNGSATRHAMTVKMKEWMGVKNVSVERAAAGELKGRLALRPSYSVMSPMRYEKFFKTKLRSWEESVREYVTRGVPCAS